MNRSYFDFPYRVPKTRHVNALQKAALAMGVILNRSQLIRGARYLDDLPEATRKRPLRDLYDDGDSEQREGEADPGLDPVADARRGKIDPRQVDQPGEAASRRD